MRHLLLVHIAHDRRVGRGAQRIEQEGNLVLFDEAPHILHRLRWAVAVIQRNEVDLVPGDAALVVHHLEKCGVQLADRTVGGNRPAIRHRVADLDLGRRHAGCVGGLGPTPARTHHRRGRAGRRSCSSPDHVRLPPFALGDATGAAMCYIRAGIRWRNSVQAGQRWRRSVRTPIEPATARPIRTKAQARPADARGRLVCDCVTRR